MDCAGQGHRQTAMVHEEAESKREGNTNVSQVSGSIKGGKRRSDPKSTQPTAIMFSRPISRAREHCILHERSAKCKTSSAINDRRAPDLSSQVVGHDPFTVHEL